MSTDGMRSKQVGDEQPAEANPRGPLPPGPVDCASSETLMVTTPRDWQAYFDSCEVASHEFMAEVDPLPAVERPRRR